MNKVWTVSATSSSYIDVPSRYTNDTNSETICTNNVTVNTRRRQQPVASILPGNLGSIVPGPASQINSGII